MEDVFMCFDLCDAAEYYHGRILSSTCILYKSLVHITVFYRVGIFVVDARL